MPVFTALPSEAPLYWIFMWRKPSIFICDVYVPGSNGLPREFKFLGSIELRQGIQPGFLLILFPSFIHAVNIYCALAMCQAICLGWLSTRQE